MSKQRIVLVVVDSLGWWVFEKFLENYPESFISKMYREGLSFTRNYSTSSYSYPSYPSILFGVNPHEHGVLSKFGYKLKTGVELRSIHECLKERGWEVSTLRAIWEGLTTILRLDCAWCLGSETRVHTLARRRLVLAFWQQARSILGVSALESQ